MYEGKGYGDLKKDLSEVVADALGPIRARTTELLSDKSELTKILHDGAERAREVASATLANVYRNVGFIPAK